MSQVTNCDFIVKGEAPESDMEEDVFSNRDSTKKIKQTIDSNIIDGEAEESDEEMGSFSKLSLTLNTATEANESITTSSTTSIKQIPNEEQSILHQKLYECNFSLWNNLNNFLKENVSAALKQLTATDQMLVQSQVSLQSASRSIRKVNELTADVRDKTRNLLEANFLPNIIVKESG